MSSSRSVLFLCATCYIIPQTILRRAILARGNAPSEYPPSDSESRSDALAGVRGKPRRRRARSYGPTEGRRRRRSLEACAKRSREAEAAKERPFFTESNKGLGIAAPRQLPTRAKPASFRERETNPLDRPRQIRLSSQRGLTDRARQFVSATANAMRRSEAEGSRADRRSSARAKRSDRKGPRSARLAPRTRGNVPQRARRPP